MYKVERTESLPATKDGPSGPRTSSVLWPTLVAWLPIPVILVALVILAVFHTDAVWNPPQLIPILNIAFLAVVSFGISLVAARSFLVGRVISILFLGCGTLVLGLGTVVAALPIAGQGPNSMVTVYNTGACLAGFCHLASSAVSMTAPRRRILSSRVILPACYLGIIALVIVLVTLVRARVWPVYFIQGSGETAFGLTVVYTTAALFAISAVLFIVQTWGTGLSFRRWYGLGLGLIAVGLFGVSFQTSIGDALNWVGRSAQYLGGIYLLVAVALEVRRTGAWLLPVERALRESEDRYQSIVNLSPDGILVCAGGRFTFANPAAVALLGAESPEEIVGKELMDLVPPEQREVFDQFIDQAKNCRLVSPLETLFTRLDGRLAEVEIAGAMVESEGGFVTQLVVRDIAGRKRAEEEREAKVEFLRLVNQSRYTAELIKSAATFFHQLSGCEAVGLRLREAEDFPYYVAHGFPECFIRAENQLCARDDNGDLRRDEVGDPVLECMCGNVICGRFDSSKPFFTERGSFWTNSTTELLRTTTDGDRQARTRNRCNGEGYESVALIPLQVGEERLGLIQLNDRRRGVFTAQFISEWETLADYLAIALSRFRAGEERERLLAAEQEARTRAEEAVRQRDEFLSVASHELKTPITSMLGFAQLAQRRLERDGRLEGEEGRRSLNIIEQQTKKLSGLISRLLDIARIESGKLTVERRETDLADLAERMVTATQMSSASHAITLKSPGRMIAYVDQFRLEQVLTNLLDNAVKFSPDETEVEVELTWSNMAEVRMSVRDHGPGIPSEHREGIFSRFYQVQRDKRGGGMGLGLYISNEIVALHGGFITVEFPEDGGTRFVVSLPVGTEVSSKEPAVDRS